MKGAIIMTIRCEYEHGERDNPYSWEDDFREMSEIDSNKELYNKAYDEWLNILDGKHVREKAVNIVNTIFQDFTNDSHLLVADLLEAITKAEEI